LVQGIALGRGYKRGANSPTFALAHEYRTPKGNVYHMDMYRLSLPELRAFPLEEYWQDGLCLIEWADRVKDRLPQETLTLELRAPRPSLRTVTIRAPSPHWQTRLQTLILS
jgi:tRNA threonylcarbamoyl adenosine modification protein YjeE